MNKVFFNFYIDTLTQLTVLSMFPYRYLPQIEDRISKAVMTIPSNSSQRYRSLRTNREKCIQDSTQVRLWYHTRFSSIALKYRLKTKNLRHHPCNTKLWTTAKGSTDIIHNPQVSNKWGLVDLVSKTLRSNPELEFNSELFH